MSGKTVIVASPHGFCSGVARAVETIEQALDTRPQPIYCLNEIVHNRSVVDNLAARGAVFVKSLADVPRGSTVLFSAHGVPPVVREEAAARGLKAIDATCPFVSKVHREVQRYAGEGCSVICIGHPGHEEVAGVVGEAPEHIVVVETADEARRVTVRNPGRVAVVTQTTLSPDSVTEVLAVLRERFPGLRTPDRSDICYATLNRQEAVRALAARVELVAVLGSANSSNSRRLVEAARAAGCRSVLVSGREDLALLPLDGVERLGITSGASTPESFLDDVLRDLAGRGFARVEWFTAVEERAKRFPLPAEIAGGSDGPTP